MSPFTIPAPSPLSKQDEAALADMVSKIRAYAASRAGARVGQPYVTWEMDLRARDFPVPEKLLRFAYTQHVDAQKRLVAAEVAFGFADRTESHFVPEPLSFRPLQPYLTGNEFERVFPAPTSAAVPAGEWDHWGEGLSAEICRHYERHIYPKVVDVVRAIAERRPERPLVAMDLGGGEGTLAETICAKVPRVGAMTVLERSAPLVAQAKARAATHAGRMSAERADLTASDFAIRGTPDVVILCGVIAQQVMTRDEGLRLAREVHRALTSGGFLLVPSYSPALLASRDYEAMGFTVHNKTLHVVTDGRGGPVLNTNDFYVLEKGS